MFIMLVTRGYATARYPFNGIFEFDQAKALVNAGNKVIMACPDIRSIRRIRKLGWNHLTKDGVEIYSYSIPIGAVPYPIAQFFGRYAFGKLVKRIIRDHGKPDVAHAHFDFVAAYSGRICKEHGIPFVVTEHNSTVNQDVWTQTVLLEAQNAYRYADALIAVSSTLGRRIKENCGKDVVKIPNIVDTEVFSYIPSKRSGGIAFYATGSLLWSKGFDLLLDAFARVHAKHAEVKLFIVGDGPEKKNLSDMVIAAGLTGSVSLLGPLMREEMAQAYRNADFFVLASRGETFGVVYIEAMASGLPVIATRCGGPEDFVTDNDGVMVPVDDVDALEAAMEYMVAHRDTYDRMDISNRVKERFSPAEIADRLMEVYRCVLNETTHKGERQ